MLLTLPRPFQMGLEEGKFLRIQGYFLGANLELDTVLRQGPSVSEKLRQIFPQLRNSL
jgi:hypothetical protein